MADTRAGRLCSPARLHSASGYLSAADERARRQRGEQYGRSRSSERSGSFASIDRSSLRFWRSGFEILPVTGSHAEHAGGLPRHHDDPFDRLIIAQAYLEGMVLGTHDRLMRPYEVLTLGLD